MKHEVERLMNTDEEWWWTQMKNEEYRWKMKNTDEEWKIEMKIEEYRWRDEKWRILKNYEGYK